MPGPERETITATELIRVSESVRHGEAADSEQVLVDDYYAPVVRFSAT